MKAIFKNDMKILYPFGYMQDENDECWPLQHEHSFIDGDEYIGGKDWIKSWGNGKDKPNNMGFYAYGRKSPLPSNEYEAEYWKNRCEAAEMVIHLFPVAGHYINTEDAKKQDAYDKWRELKSQNPKV